MICIDGMTRTNGAIAFAPGSHHVSNEKLRRNKTRKSPRWGRRTRLALCPPGSAIVFDSKVLHGSGPNRSSMARRTFIVQLGMGCDRLIASHHEDWTGTALHAIRRGLAGGAPRRF